MDNNSQLFHQEIEKRFESLSIEEKNIILNTDNKNILKEIMDKYKLSIDQMVDLENETMAVILRLNRSRGFIDRLKKILPETKTTNLALEIEEKIFQPVKIKLATLESAKQKDTQIDDVPKIPLVNDSYREQPDTKPFT